MIECTDFKARLLEHRDLIKNNVPQQLYLEMNILSYYSLVNDLDLYFKSFQFVFAKLINGITAEDFLSDVHPWIENNCPARDIVRWSADVNLATGDVIFYTPTSGFLKNRVMNLVVTDPDKHEALDWKMKTVDYSNLTKISILTPTSVTYHDVTESNAIEQWNAWEDTNGTDWYKAQLNL